MTSFAPNPEPHDRRIFKARYVFPVAGPPLRDAAVTIAGARIAAVGQAPADAPVEDLGNVAILPGLVNAHVHLDLSGCRKPIGPPGIDFVDWLRRVIQVRIESSTSKQAVAAGLRECLDEGIGALGDIAQPGVHIEAADNAPIDVTAFLELLGPTPDRADAASELARAHLEGGQASAMRHAGLSPHAPYTVRPELLRAAVRLAAANNAPVAFHLAESREEDAWLRDGDGPLADLLRERGVDRPDALRLGSRPLDYLKLLATAPTALVIHGNYLDDEEIAFLGANAQRLSAVYCPRTHAHFGHARYPLDKMLAAGVRVALGTDSRASAPDLSVLAEMRFVARRYPEIPMEVVLRLGTLDAAAALGRDKDYGSIEPGKRAALAVVSLPDRDAADPHELLFARDASPVVRGISGARWCSRREPPL